MNFVDTEVVYSGIFTVLTIKEHGLEELCNSAGKDRSADYNGLLNLLRRVSVDPKGSRCLTTEQCHPIDKGNDIYQFRKGDLRMLWFHDGRNIIVCVGG